MPSYEIYKEITFEAAHQIEGHKDPITGEPGKCAREHGHTYTLGVAVLSQVLDEETSFVMDYYLMGVFLKRIHTEFDHQNLNKLPRFEGYRTTAENIAQMVARDLSNYIFYECSDKFHLRGVTPFYVLVKETASTYAKYYL